MKKTATVILLLVTIGVVYAQKGIDDGSIYEHGQDSINCLRNKSLYGEYYKQGDYKTAYPFWREVFNYCPKASKNTYIHGIKIVEYMLENATSDAEKEAYIDTLMQVYDQRIQYFGQRGYVLQRKGVDMLKYRRTNISDIQEGYQILKEGIELQQVKAKASAIATFMTAAITLYDNGTISDATLINNYMSISGIIDQKQARSASGQLEQVKSVIDDNIIKTGVLSCEKVVEIYRPKFEATPNDETLLLKITETLDKLECTQQPFYYTIATKLYSIKPTVTAAVALAQIALSNNQTYEAINYFTEAIEKESNEANKADYYYGLAVAQNKAGHKSDARANALKAAGIKTNWGAPYILIGKMYIDSKTNCAGISLPGAVYWLAVDYFNKAQHTEPAITETAEKLIETYSAYFPNKEEAFFHEIHEGDSYTVGCWINEDTKARF